MAIVNETGEQRAIRECHEFHHRLLEQLYRARIILSGFLWVNFYVLLYLYVADIVSERNRLFCGIAMLLTLMLALAATITKSRITHATED